MASEFLPPINNYIYLYHTDQLFLLPFYPAQISDSTSANFGQSTVMGRSAPIYSYQNSGPRSFQVQMDLRRDMMYQIQGSTIPIQSDKEDYIDCLINALYSMALPNYGQSEKMVDPPIALLKLGEDIMCKGIIQGGVGVTYGLPILTNGKYAQVSISFTLSEVEPYSANQAYIVGGFRNPGDTTINTTLDSEVYVKPETTSVTKVSSSSSGGHSR